MKVKLLTKKTKNVYQQRRNFQGYNNQNPKPKSIQSNVKRLKFSIFSMLFILCKFMTLVEAQKSTFGNNQQNSQHKTNHVKIDWANIGIKNITNDLPELSTDWLMLGGSNTDFKSRPGSELGLGAVSGGSADSTSDDLMVPTETRNLASFTTESGGFVANRNYSSSSGSGSGRRSGSSKRRSSQSRNNKTASGGQQQQFDDEQQSDSSESNEIFDDVEEVTLAGTQKEPECASHGRYYCTYKEDYPVKLVSEVTKYYKWPIEKLFRDLHAQIMPKLAQDSNGNLVCDSITRVVRPGWARNTNDRWLVVINTDNYHQYVTEVVCQYGSNSRCNFIPPCYYSSCQQRYNTQKLLVIDPTNPYRGPFLSEFLFPSCCVCYVPTTSDSLNDKFRPSPASIYQRTMQQESSTNQNPPYRQPADRSSESDSQASSFMEHPIRSSAAASSTQQTKEQQPSQSQSSQSTSSLNPQLQPLGPGEIRRSGEIHISSHSANNNHKPRQTRDNQVHSRPLSNFPNIVTPHESSMSHNNEEASASSSKS